MKISIRGMNKNKKRIPSKQARRLYAQMARTIGSQIFNLQTMQEAADCILDKKVNE